MVQRDRTKQPQLSSTENVPGELLSGHNLLFLEELYEEYLNDPMSVDARWRSYFEGMERGEFSVDLRPQASRPMTSVSNGTANGQHMYVPARTTFAPLQLEATKFASRESRTDLPAALAEWTDRLAFLNNFQFFRGMSQQDLEQIAAIVREATFEAGEYLCHEGETGAYVHILIEGRVNVQRQTRFVVELGPGEVIGELSVLDGCPRFADVVAITPVTALEIRGQDFHALLRSNYELVDSLLRVLVARVREASDRQERVTQLVHAFREKGHALAQLDPLGDDAEAQSHPELTMSHYGLTDLDLDTRFTLHLGRANLFAPLRQIVDQLRQIYCGSIGIQYMHIDDLYVQEWLRERMEDPIYHQKLQRDKQLRILETLTDAELFETFLHRKFLGAKRFSLEGAESLIPLMAEAIEKAGEYGVQEVIIGMAHRGRLNVLANILRKPTSQIFREFEDADPELHEGGGDVKYHLGYSKDVVTSSGREVHLSLCFNPSHLEAVGPVVLGRARAKQQRVGDKERKQVLPIVMHGDAAFIGQGVVQEIFNLSELPGYTVGGCVHIIVNNQIGFTTAPDDSRSSDYATDIARMLQIPILHVNGEDPEAVDRVIQIAMEFRHTFQKDIVIDMYCYRRHGHNEGDEPAYTQPLLYKNISKHQSVRAAYVENLLKLGEITAQEAEEIAERSRKRLEEELERARSEDYEYKPVESGKGVWSPYRGGRDHLVPDVDTGVDKATLSHVLHAQTELPESFTPHRKIKKHFQVIKAMADGHQPLNWGAGELLAFGTLLLEGNGVRITGQDSQRGTFSHRHAALHDIVTGGEHIPLQHLSQEQGAFEIFNSPLSETGVLGYEFGYSLDQPEGLVVWEAQFGDFCNMAQVIFDQFISSSEAKWNRLSGLCVLLPHGFEGQGPEHSSARLERFLELAAQDNMQIVNITTPAQFFHCIRRQIRRPLRKPLIVMAPKSLLRHRRAVSQLEEFTHGHFQRLIPDLDPAIHTDKVERVLMCSGKIYYELLQTREAEKIENLPIIRLEQYFPFPMDKLKQTLSHYKKGTKLIWVQEEPENMGAWPFLCRTVLPHFAGSDYPMEFISRPEASSPATGSKAWHDLEQKQIIDQAMKGE